MSLGGSSTETTQREVYEYTNNPMLALGYFDVDGAIAMPRTLNRPCPAKTDEDRRSLFRSDQIHRGDTSVST